MSFKERLLQMKKLAERQQQTEVEETRRKEAAVLAERSRYPKVEEVEAHKLENIVQIANNNVLVALKDFGAVMWGAELTDVDGVMGRDHTSYTWFAGYKSSRAATKTTYHDYGLQRYLGFSRICKVELGVRSISESKFLKEQTMGVSFYHGSESQRQGKRDIEREYGSVKWEHSFGWLEPAASFMPERLGRFDYCVVMGIGGVSWGDRLVVFGFDELSYLEKLERGLERIVKTPEKLSEYTKMPPFSYEH